MLRVFICVVFGGLVIWLWFVVLICLVVILIGWFNVG